MAVAYHIFTNIIQKLKAQVPTLTQEDIVTTLDIIYMSCVGYNDVADSVGYITAYYKKQDETLDTELFRKNLHDCFAFLDQENLEILRNLIHVISINNVFNHPLLLFDFSEFVNENITNVNFIEKKVKVIKQENIDFIKKISSCTNLNTLNKWKMQLNDNLEILRHFRLIFEKQEMSILPGYNFIATQMQYLRNDEDHKNAVTLINNEYQKIKELVVKDSRFKDVLIIVKSNDDISYQLNIKEVHNFFKMEIINLLNEYQAKIFEVKRNKTRGIQIQIKGIKLKIQNILDLSKIVLEIFHKPVEFLPLTKLINELFYDMGPIIYLNEIEKVTDDSIEMIKKLNKKLQEILSTNDVRKQESLVLIKDMSIDDKVSTKKIEVKTRKKKKKTNKKVNNSKNINVSETSSAKPSTSKAVPFVAEVIPDINTTLEEQKVDMKKQSIDGPNSIKETLSNDESLKTKINELETQLKQTQEELNKVNFSFIEETSLLSHQLLVAQQKVQILSGETQLLLSKISDLENEKQKLENVKDQNSKKIDHISKNLTKEQKKVKNVRDQKKQSIEKLREKEETLLFEKKQLMKENRKSSQQLEKLNQELAKARDALMITETKNQKLATEVNKLKTEKIKLENTKANNDIQIKAKEENISLLEKKLATTTNQESSEEVQKLLQQKEKLITEKKQLMKENRKSSQQLIILISRLNQKVQALSQLEVYNPNLATFIDNYEITPCTQVTPIIGKRLVPGTVVIDEMMEVIKPVPVLVRTGKQVLVPTEIWEDVYIADELTQGFCLQPKPSTM